MTHCHTSLYFNDIHIGIYVQVAASKARHKPEPSPLSQLNIGQNMRRQFCHFFRKFWLLTFLFRVVSFLTCNFFQMRFAALCITFIINFLLLFYKASAVDSDDGDGDDDDEDGDDGSAEDASADGDDGGDDDDDPDEWIHVDPEYYYVEYIVSGFAISYAIVAFFMVIAYYNLKVPLGIFKREKEVGRRVEFDGLYLSEQVAFPVGMYLDSVHYPLLIPA